MIAESVMTATNYNDKECCWYWMLSILFHSKALLVQHLVGWVVWFQQTVQWIGTKWHVLDLADAFIQRASLTKTKNDYSSVLLVYFLSTKNWKAYFQSTFYILLKNILFVLLRNILKITLKCTWLILSEKSKYIWPVLLLNLLIETYLKV